MIGLGHTLNLALTILTCIHPEWFDVLTQLLKHKTPRQAGRALEPASAEQEEEAKAQAEAKLGSGNSQHLRTSTWIKNSGTNQIPFWGIFLRGSLVYVKCGFVTHSHRRVALSCSPGSAESTTKDSTLHSHRFCFFKSLLVFESLGYCIVRLLAARTSGTAETKRQEATRSKDGRAASTGELPGSACRKQVEVDVKRSQRSEMLGF